MLTHEMLTPRNYIKFKFKFLNRGSSSENMKYGDYKLQLKPWTRFCCRLTIQFPPLCWPKMNIFSDSHPQRKGSYNINFYFILHIFCSPE